MIARCMPHPTTFNSLMKATIHHLENEIIKHLPPDEIVKQLKHKMSKSSETFKADFRQEVDEKESILQTSHLSMYARATSTCKSTCLQVIFNRCGHGALTKCLEFMPQKNF